MCECFFFFLGGGVFFFFSWGCRLDFLCFFYLGGVIVVVCCFFHGGNFYRVSVLSMTSLEIFRIWLILRTARS